MKALVDGLLFSRALSRVGAVIPSRAARPVLQNVSLSVRGDSLILCGTDMEVGVRTAIPAGAKTEDGDALLSAARLRGIVSELADQQIALSSTTGDFQTTVAADGSFFKLVGEDPADFPAVPSFPEKPDKADVVTTPLGHTRRLVRMTAFAASAEETRYAIHGLLMEVQGKTLRFVATDGKRLATGTLALKKKRAKKASRLLPPRAWRSILSAAEGVDDDYEIDLVLEERRVLARVGPTTVVASIYDGTFPSYEQIIPKSSAIEVQIPTEDFASAVRRASLIANEESRAVMLRFSDGKLRASSRVSNVGEGELEVLIEYDFPPLEVSVNPKYILDFLKATEHAQVQVGLKDARSPVVMRDESGHDYCVMPVILESTE